MRGVEDATRFTKVDGCLQSHSLVFQSRMVRSTNCCGGIRRAQMLLSVGQQPSGEVWANGASVNPAISGDSLYVAFSSRATNLSTTDTNATDDIFTHTWVDASTRTQCDTKKTDQDASLPDSVGSYPRSARYGLRREMPGRHPDGPHGSDLEQDGDGTVLRGLRRVPSISPDGGPLIPLYVRYGNVPTYSTKDGWSGWGYRHIYVKHGWSAFIRGKVALALGEPPDIPHQGNASIYKHDYTYNGTSCRITVLVVWDPLPVGSD
jgi:hypothetical protein